MTPAAPHRWRIEVVRDATPRRRALSLAAVMLLALALCGLLLRAAGADPGTALAALVRGAFGSLNAATETLVRATPLIFTGLAAATAFRARVWNIGAEGQVFAGAICAYGLSHGLAGLSPLVQLPVVLAGAMIGGAAWAGLAGLLKTACRVDEVISTVMLNYIIVYVLSMLLLKGPWSEAGGFFEQTAKVDPGSVLPVILPGTRLHLGFALALLAALAMQVLLARTPLGYEIRGAGSNLRALSVQGASAARILILVMILSGLLAGLAGATEVYGVHGRLKAGAITGFGYAGIVVAILGGLRPWGVVGAAIFFGALVNGGTYMQIKTGVPSALIYAFEAIILLACLAGWAAAGLRIRKVADAV
ncbi:MAG: ABC transporter permease [Proteobacteria bacterium]|nr:ABC transporter permease [Pseudomonadota bacterium]MBS0571670.1 ABC transporter permease [Pseudomonadota bacterium]